MHILYKGLILHGKIQRTALQLIYQYIYFFLNKATWITKYHILENDLPVISVFKTRCFPWIHLKKTKLLLFCSLSFILIANSIGASFSASYKVLTTLA